MGLRGDGICMAVASNSTQAADFNLWGSQRRCSTAGRSSEEIIFLCWALFSGDEVIAATVKMTRDYLFELF